MAVIMSLSFEGCIDGLTRVRLWMLENHGFSISVPVMKLSEASNERISYLWPYVNTCLPMSSAMTALLSKFVST